MKKKVDIDQKMKQLLQKVDLLKQHDLSDEKIDTVVQKLENLIEAFEAQIVEQSATA